MLIIVSEFCCLFILCVWNCWLHTGYLCVCAFISVVVSSFQNSLVGRLFAVATLLWVWISVVIVSVLVIYLLMYSHKYLPLFFCTCGSCTRNAALHFCLHMQVCVCMLLIMKFAFPRGSVILKCLHFIQFIVKLSSAMKIYLRHN